MLHCGPAAGQEIIQTGLNERTPSTKGKYTHYLGVEFRPGFVIPSPPFYKEADDKDLSTKHALSAHLKYSFSLPSGTLGDQIFANTKQGVGIGYFDFGNKQELGTPISAYLFQNEEIAHFTRSLTLDYEWNFGLSNGWKPYDPETNPQNVVVGSRLNAYINLAVYLTWRLGQRLYLSSGVDFTHFSNGNTEYPNAGFNTTGFKLGMRYDINKQTTNTENEAVTSGVPTFPRHVSYDLVFFGAWRRKGVEFFDQMVASPYKYAVAGAYFAPMYNLGYRFRTGLSLDAIYDGSANVYTQDYIVGTPQEFFQPKWDRQVALGLSARAEYVMPIFTIGLGIGTNVLHRGGDLRGTYQNFALKIRTNRSTFIHIGYSLKDFHDPNHLMLGFGFNFNNRTPHLLSH